jgi:hypothetical protein
VTTFGGLAPEPTPSEIIIKLIVLAAAGVALAIGAAVGLALSSTANAKLVVSCEGSSCSVQLPGAILDEMNLIHKQFLISTGCEAESPGRQ